MSKIFISIASYRDPELIPTIIDCIKKAKYPNNLRFGICRQYHPEDGFDDLSFFKKDERFRIIDILYTESKGVCWARNKIQSLYNNEKYTLQLDSHHRFLKDWDEELINMFLSLQKEGYKKPLITAYASEYETDYKNDYFQNNLYDLYFDRFILHGPILPSSSLIKKDDERLKFPIPSRFLSAHFIFTLGQFCKEVKYNPEIFFHGEESSMAVRAWTCGYDMFNPNKIIIWHEYFSLGKNNRVRVIDDIETNSLDINSYLVYRKLFGIDGISQEGHNGEYGFGKERTLKEYERWAGIRFSDRSVTKCTLNRKLPKECIYNSEEEFNSDLVKFYKHGVIIPKNFLQINSYDYWIASFYDQNDNIVYRKRLNTKEIKEAYKDNDSYFKFWCEFNYENLPKKFVLTTYINKDKSFIDKIESPL